MSDDANELVGGEGGFTISRTGMPPGNPNHIGPNEAATRKSEIAELGADVAAQRAWNRANEARAKKAGGPAGANAARPGKTKGPERVTDFADALPPGAVRHNAKGRSRADVERWSRSIMLAHAMLAMKLENGDWAISEDESMMLTEAVLDVLEEYNIKLKGAAGKWGALVYAVGLIYGPRVGAEVIKRIKSNNPQTA